MGNLFKIAIRNLIRYKRRTILTGSLVAIGIIFVLVFVAASASFKNIMIGEITDSMLGHHPGSPERLCGIYRQPALKYELEATSRCQSGTSPEIHTGGREPYRHG